VLRAIATAEAEQQQLVAAVMAGGADVQALVAALRERQERLVRLRAELQALRHLTRISLPVYSGMY
jgi:hypothetical protein